MIILGVETSCDETSIAVLEAEQKKADFFIRPLGSTVSSQIKIHAQYGGIVPMLASREHAKNLSVVFQKTMKEAFGSSKNLASKIDLITVTQGPGLIPALLIGVNFTKTLAWAWHKPIVGVNHLEGHLLSFVLEQNTHNFQSIFPAICLLVSGGHTQLIYVQKIGEYKIIGETRDDAAGECFDKGARILGLGYPGGPIISHEADRARIKNKTIQLPRPMLHSPDYDFSFSGLKTALLYLWNKLDRKEKKKLIPNLAFELQEAITDVLVEKTLRAAREYKVRSIVLGGGVTANQRLREKLQSRSKDKKKAFNFYLPLLKYTTDNASMIALAGYFNFLRSRRKMKDFNWKNVETDANLRF
jgi:N6-L-threonylcarbamoyladenine synthase